MNWSSSDLDGKTIIVTGAGRGLGRAFAEEFVRRGAAVVVNDVAADAVAEACESLRAAGGRAVGVVGSVAEDGVADELVATGTASFDGVLGGLVNNAGRFDSASAGEISAAVVRDLVEVNVVGALLCGSAVFRHFQRHGGGTILNVTSGAFLGVARMSLYGATKGAVASATYAWAVEGAEHGINVNALSPIAATGLTPQWRSAEKIADQLGPERIAPVAAYLMSDAAREVTGQVVRTDGRSVSLIAAPALTAVTRVHDESRASVDGALRSLLDQSLPFGRRLAR